MEFFAENILLIIFLPIWTILIIIASIIFKMNGNKKITLLTTLISTFTGLIFSIGLFNYVRIPNTLIIEKNYLWLPFENFNLYLGTLIDAISTSFLVILMLVSFIVQLYSYGYMRNKEEFSKYYIYLNFFNFSMIGLILSTNLFQTYIFWELVGIASYLLIGFFHKKEDVSKSAKKVFIINRIGDCAFLTGLIMLIWFSFNNLNQSSIDIISFTDMDSFQTLLNGASYPLIYDIICLLLLFSCFVKSAQFPMHLWLIDAMKAPTPVSALIHSATMVCMGIYLTIRLFPLLTPEIFNIILLTGAVTAFLCAFIAITQTNIKKMLAYSTSSQLGFVFIALGFYSIPAAIIYLIIHSFTKALLFLCTGAIEQKFNGIIDMNETGCLRKNDFYTALYWIIGALSLSGLFFGGFTSKEMIINLAKTSNSISVLILILLTSYLSTFYIFKAYFLIFEQNTNKEISKTNEKTMNSSMMILCLFIIIPGFIFKLSDLNTICIITTIIGLLAIVNAFASYKSKRIMIPKAIYRLSNNELYIPQIYGFIESCFAVIFKAVFLSEKYIFDNIPYVCARISKFISSLISKFQNGNIQTYISYSLFSMGIIITCILLFYIIMGEI